MHVADGIRVVLVTAANSGLDFLWKCQEVRGMNDELSSRTRISHRRIEGAPDAAAGSIIPHASRPLPKNDFLRSRSLALHDLENHSLKVTLCTRFVHCGRALWGSRANNTIRNDPRRDVRKLNIVIFIWTGRLTRLGARIHTPRHRFLYRVTKSNLLLAATPIPGETADSMNLRPSKPSEHLLPQAITVARHA